MVNNDVRVDVGAADDVRWDVLHPCRGMMCHDLTVHSLLGLRVAGRSWYLASRELLHVLCSRGSSCIDIITNSPIQYGQVKLIELDI